MNHKYKEVEMYIAKISKKIYIYIYIYNMPLLTCLIVLHACNFSPILTQKYIYNI